MIIENVCSCSIQMLMNTGIKYSSPTLSTAMTDLVPAFTFLLAVISRCVFTTKAQILGKFFSALEDFSILFFFLVETQSAACAHLSCSGMRDRNREAIDMRVESTDRMKKANITKLGQFNYSGNFAIWSRELQSLFLGDHVPARWMMIQESW